MTNSPIVSLKFLVLAFLVVFGCQSLFAQQEIKRMSSSGEEEAWTLAFGDDFEGNALDTKKWKVTEGIPRDPYQEWASVWYTKDNSMVYQG